MPLTREQYSEITKIINERRREALRAQKILTEKIFTEFPAVKKYTEEMARMSQEEVILRLKKDIVAAEKLSSRRHELKHKKDDLLRRVGYPEGYLKVRYTCELCGDIGFIGREKCGCFKKLESSLLNRESGLPLLMEKENFDTLDTSVYDDAVNLDEFLPKRITQYQYMTMPGGIIDKVKNFVRSFDDKCSNNMIMFGPAGTGKTFLSNCIAKALIEKQYTVSYERAGDMFERMTRLNFSFKEDPSRDDIDRRILESELLIIDDLGTEYATDYTKAKLFSIISSRLSGGKSTIISTNLSMDQLKDFYGERISSRLMGDYLLMPFVGADIRISKGRLVS